MTTRGASSGTRAAVAYRAVGLAGALVLLGLVVQQLVTVFAAAILVLIISLPVSAAAGKAERLGLPRALGAVLALLAAAAVAMALGLLIVPEFAAEARQFAARLPTIIKGAEHEAHVLTGVSSAKLNADASRFTQGYIQHPSRLLGPLETIGLGLAGVLVAVVVMLISVLYIAIDPDPLRAGLLALLPGDRRAHAERVMMRVRAAWMGWLLAIGIDMLVLGGLLYLGMRIVGLEFAIGFAVLSALMTVIPNYGSIISAVPPILLGLSHSPREALLVLAVYVIVNQLEGNVILPLVMARNVDVHPALVAVGLLVMAQLFGILGMLIAIPLLSLTMILVEELWVGPQEAAALAKITHPNEGPALAGPSP
jgi:predicted PurR-regulated permease PerM